VTAEIRIGTRASALALAQSQLVAEALERKGGRTRLVKVETEGDRRRPDTPWGEGAFVKSIERALLENRVDVAVHSAKDVPTAEDHRLRIAAYLTRADPRDALVVRQGESGRLDELPTGSRVGTDSPRRSGFLRARRPDVTVHALHGNVDTRLRRLDAGETDCLVLAAAGLDRLGLADRIGQRLGADVIPSAPGQGAIAVQVRRDDARTRGLVAGIDDGATRLAVEAERAFLAASGGGCRAPIGALATLRGDELDLLGGYASPDGLEAVIATRRGPANEGAELARELAADLTARRQRLAQAKPPRILLTRAAGQADELAPALRGSGLEPVIVPAIEVEDEPPGALDAAARMLHTYVWVVVTSANGARAILKAAERVLTLLETSRFAVVGRTTRSVLEREGIEVDYQPAQPSSSALAAGLPLEAGDRLLVVRGDLADGELTGAFRTRGAVVDDVVAYRTLEAPESSRPLLRQALADGRLDAVILTSGSTVRGLVSLARAEGLEVMSIPAVCIGPETATVAERAGFSVVAISPQPAADVLAETVAKSLTRQEQETR
jgi:hydroxymethylbilane synthase